MSGLPERLAARVAIEASARGGTLVVGMCGAQGSGKSTLAREVRRLLLADGVSCAALSLDDLYLSRGERARLAEEVHPLFATRGVPGTHDVELGIRVVEALGRAGRVRLPRFDKAADDPFPAGEWPEVEGPIDVLLFEGWCVGAAAQPNAMLDRPVNRLEAEEDRGGRWRRAVNAQLAGGYQALFARIGLLVMLAAPSFEVVLGWRLQQERELRAAGGGAYVMSDDEIARFIAHYERLTRWMIEEMPLRADIVAQLGERRELLATKGL